MNDSYDAGLCLINLSVYLAELNDVFVAGLPGLVPVYQQRSRSLQYARVRSAALVPSVGAFCLIFFSKSSLIPVYLQKFDQYLP